MSLESIKGLRRTNLTAEIASNLRRLIAEGNLLPGTHLVESDVAEKLGVSRGSLREALCILESEGLVNRLPGRGSFVAKISERDIREIYSLRTIMEKEALRLAVDRITQKDVEDLESILDLMFLAAEEGDNAEVLDLDLKFHERIWEIADHSRLKSYLDEIAVHVRMYVAIQTSQYESLSVGISDHRQLLDAINSGDADTATKIIVEHLQVATNTLLECFVGYFTEQP
jgi:DNA-binding GntR family transcriptional regulator